MSENFLYGFAILCFLLFLLGICFFMNKGDIEKEKTIQKAFEMGYIQVVDRETENVLWVKK